MTDNELIEWCQNQNLENQMLEIPEDFYENLNLEQAKMISKYFEHEKLINLPSREIEFFEWLKLNDNKIWIDLWDESVPPYLVSITFLPVLIYSEKRGFPICDLVNNDNYFFTAQHMVDEESKALVESSRARLLQNQSLSVSQLLSLEITASPIDIWHFAYKYKIELDKAIQAVHNLVADNVLVHLKDAEYLSSFVDF